MATTSVVIIVVVCRVTREMATAAQTLMNAKATLFSVEFMPLVITPMVLTNASVTQDGQAAVQTAQTSTNVLMGHTLVLRTHIAQIIKAVTHVHVCMGGNVSGLNHTGDVPSAIQTPSAQVMESAYEMVLVIALGIIEELTAQYACQKSDAQAMGTVTLTGSAIVTMAGQGNHSTADGEINAKLQARQDQYKSQYNKSSKPLPATHPDDPVRVLTPHDHKSEPGIVKCSSQTLAHTRSPWQMAAPSGETAVIFVQQERTLKSKTISPVMNH